MAGKMGSKKTYGDSRRKRQLKKNREEKDKQRRAELSPREIEARKYFQKRIEQSYAGAYEKLKKNPETAEAFTALEEEIITAREELQGVSVDQQYKRIHELLVFDSPLNKKQIGLNIIVKRLNKSLPPGERFLVITKGQLQHWLGG